MRNVPRSTENGSVAVLSLWVVVILAFMAVGLARSVHQKITVFERLSAREITRVLGESSVKKLIAQVHASPMMLGDVATGQEWYYDLLGKKQSFAIGSAVARFTVEDENSKINLNKAELSVLADLFYQVSRLSAEEATQLAQAVLDFRDEDDFVTGENNGGSEIGSYREAGLAGAPKNHDLELIEELMLVKGVTKEIYGSVADYITIYGNGRVNINTCKKETLVILGLTGSLADKILSMRNGRVPKARTQGPFIFKDLSRIGADISDVYPLSDDEKGSLSHALAHNELSVTSDHFRIQGLAATLDPVFSSRFECIYGVRDGVKYWAEA